MQAKVRVSTYHTVARKIACPLRIGRVPPCHVPRSQGGRASQTAIKADNATCTSNASFVSLKDGVFTVQGILKTSAPPAVVFAALAPELSSTVFSSVESSTVVRDPQGGTVQVKQACRWNFLALSGTFDVVLRVTERPDQWSTTFELQQSSFMRKMDGTWRITSSLTSSSSSRDDASGDSGDRTGDSGDRTGDRTGDDGVRSTVVHHVLSVQPLVDLPLPVAMCVKSIFVDQERRILEDLAQAVARLQSELQVLEAQPPPESVEALESDEEEQLAPALSMARR